MMNADGVAVAVAVVGAQFRLVAGLTLNHRSVADAA